MARAALNALKIRKNPLQQIREELPIFEVQALTHPGTYISRDCWTVLLTRLASSANNWELTT